MNIIAELREMPETRKLTLIYLLAVLLWIALLFLLFRIYDTSHSLRTSLNTGDQIVNNAILYQASSSKGSSIPTQAIRGEPLSVLSEIVNTLGLRDRMVQLQSNVSGISLQLERVYGEELKDFLLTLDSRGLKIKTAELKALPVDNERLLAVTLLLEQN
ncbi:hypothetical protein LJC31_01470 [Synergistaceae bacterium OttesenSCG-928-I11]|nr:hypothetical protein [Synergistaceae bacterium OttesenSCG-928-I11]